LTVIVDCDGGAARRLKNDGTFQQNFVSFSTRLSGKLNRRNKHSLFTVQSIFLEITAKSCFRSKNNAVFPEIQYLFSYGQLLPSRTLQCTLCAISA
jgi:hypothetical protein